MEWYHQLQFISAVAMPDDLASAYGTTVNGMWAAPEQRSQQMIEEAHAKGCRVLFSVPLIALTPKVYHLPENRYLIDLLYAPGTVWYYGDGNPQLISGIIQETTGNSLKDFADENLFRSMGISKYYWESHADGLTYGAFGLWLIPRDMAKVGQLMLDHGMWNGERLVSEQWVIESTKKQANSRDYGYYWSPENEGKTFKASGSGNQLIWVYPEKQLVVVTTSVSYARTWVLATGSLDRIFNGIVNAIID